MSVEDCVREEEAKLACYVAESNEQLMSSCRKESVVKLRGTSTERPIQTKEHRNAEKVKNWKSKALHASSYDKLRRSETLKLLGNG